MARPSFSLAFALLLALSLSTIALALAATVTSTVSDVATATAASIYPGGTNWAYFGCYNETTLYNGTNGQRAINGGLIEALDTMTVEICLNYCKSNGFAVAGLEYTRLVSLFIVLLFQWKSSEGALIWDWDRRIWLGFG